MRKGDVMLMRFPFTDLSGSKLRPAIVLIATASDLTVCFVTSQLRWQEPTDVLLEPAPMSGIKKPSLVRTNKLATHAKSLAAGRLGSLSEAELTAIDQKLRELLQLD